MAPLVPAAVNHGRPISSDLSKSRVATPELCGRSQLTDAAIEFLNRARVCQVTLAGLKHEAELSDLGGHDADA